MTLELSVNEQHPVYTVVTVVGEFDIATAPSLDTKLAAASRVDIVLDFTEVMFLDSSGLRLLVKRLKRVKPANGEIRLVVTNPISWAHLRSPRSTRRSASTNRS